MTKKTEFSREDVEISSEETVYDGFFKVRHYQLRHKLFAGGWSNELSRELFVRHEAVGVLLYDPERDLIGLVEQFRIGALEEPNGPWCLEVVAGIIDTNESPEQVAIRELKEEANARAERMEYICQYLPSPGGTNERLHLYCGYCDLSQVAGVHGLDSEDEDIKVHVFPAAEVFDQLYSGRFNNAATLISLQWLQQRRQEWLSQ
ncbi:NUDIX domain-containing protein [Proteobacteria bacterium 005FR1]|nr:NUDIX domain-containing protein [Proteobacteria bacterium 005FR1]